MKTCPRCLLLNPDDGVVCACRFDLVNGDVVAAAAVRKAIRRRARLYQILGAVLLIFGLAGGTVYFPFHVSLFVDFGGWRIDVGVVAVGAVLLARGARMIDRPWREKVDERRTG